MSHVFWSVCNSAQFGAFSFWASDCLCRLLKLRYIQKIQTEDNTQIHCLLLLKEQSCSWIELITGSCPGQSMSVTHYHPSFHLMIHLPDKGNIIICWNTVCSSKKHCGLNLKTNVIYPWSCVCSIGEVLR
jgi:hypothetical protein